MFLPFLGIAKDIAFALIGQIAWKIIFERFLTRLAMYALRRLAKMSTNTVVNETVTDIADMLEGKGLAKAKEGQ